VTTRFLRLAWILISAIALQLNAGEIRFDYFPSEAYENEEATFVLRGSPGAALTVTLNGKTIAESTFGETALKQRLLLAEGGTLVFTSGETRREFQLVAPNSEAKLSERDGYLYQGDRPAILLPRHVHPPKHDRTWEGWKLVKSVFVTPEERRISSQLRLGRTTSQSPTFYELHDLVLQLPEAVSKDLILLQVSPQDLKRGVSDLSFRMRLEWILQKLAPLKGKQFMVVMIYDDEGTEHRYTFSHQAVKLASRSGGAEFTSVTLKPDDHLSPNGLESRVDEVVSDAFVLEPEAGN
jgi:hypothetical protein